MLNIFEIKWKNTLMLRSFSELSFVIFGATGHAWNQYAWHSLCSYNAAMIFCYPSIRPSDGCRETTQAAPILPIEFRSKNQDRSRLRFKNVVKKNLKWRDISLDTWQAGARERPVWKTMICRPKHRTVIVGSADC